MKYLFLYIFMVLIVFSCETSDKQNQNNGIPNSTKLNLPINSFIKKFKVVKLPFYFNGYNNYNIDKRNLFEINRYTTDSLFFISSSDDKIYGYGLLSDTTNFYSLLYFGVSEGLYPILATYKKDGQLISKKTLIVNGCGSDCGLTYCSYSAFIKEDYSIFLVDTAKYQGICDSLGNYLPNSDSTFINSKDGLIDKSGIIKISEEKKKVIKNSP